MAERVANARAEEAEEGVVILSQQTLFAKVFLLLCCQELLPREFEVFFRFGELGFEEVDGFGRVGGLAVGFG